MRILKITFILALLVLLLLPPAQMLFPVIDIQTIFPSIVIRPLEEQRRLAPKPDFIGQLLNGDGRLAPSVNQWFNDHVGFRSLFVRLANELDFRLFRHSRKVFIGKEGWYYDPAFSAERVFAERAGEAKARPLREKFLAIARYLSQRNIRLVIVSNPMKATIYPQFLPLEAPRLPELNQFQNLGAFLKEQREWIYIDGQDLLSRCDGGHELFLRTDHHLSPVGALCFPEEVVARIAAAEGWKFSPWDRKFEYWVHPWSNGAFGKFLSTFTVLTENMYVPTNLFDTAHPPADGYFENEPSVPFEYIYHAHASYRVDKLPRLLLFGNSFIDWTLPGGMFIYFTDVYRVRGNGSELSVALRGIPENTRYFVLQFLEPYASSFLATDVPSD